MEFVQKYWWVILIGVVAALFVASRSKSGGGGSVQTIAGSDNAALAAIASSERNADEANRVGLISTFLGYIQGNQALAAGERAQTEANATNIKLAEIGSTSAQNLQDSQNALQQFLAGEISRQQLASIRAQESVVRQQNWFNLLGTGLSTLGGIFGNSLNIGSNNAGNIGLGGGSGGGFIYH